MNRCQEKWRRGAVCFGALQQFEDRRRVCLFQFKGQVCDFLSMEEFLFTAIIEILEEGEKFEKSAGEAFACQTAF